jgi:hypothetical protein
MEPGMKYLTFTACGHCAPLEGRQLATSYQLSF